MKKEELKEKALEFLEQFIAACEKGSPEGIKAIAVSVSATPYKDAERFRSYSQGAIFGIADLPHVLMLTDKVETAIQAVAEEATMRVMGFEIAEERKEAKDGGVN